MEVAEQEPGDCPLRDRGDVGGDRRGRAFVDVGRPEMERDDRELESEAGHDEGDAGEDEAAIEFGGGQARGNEPGEVHGAAGVIEERDAEQEEGRGERGEDEVLQTGFDRQRPGVEVGDHAVERDAQQLEAEEQGDEVAARDQDRGTERGGEHEDVDLFVVSFAFREVIVGEQDEGGAGAEDHADVEDGVSIDDEERRDGMRRTGRCDPERAESGSEAGERDGGGQRVMAAEGDGEHGEDRGAGQNEEWEQRLDVGGGHLILASAGSPPGERWRAGRFGSPAADRVRAIAKRRP